MEGRESGQFIVAAVTRSGPIAVTNYLEGLERVRFYL